MPFCGISQHAKGLDSGIFVPKASAADGVYGGTCGENVNWSFDDNTGVLRIFGSGDMSDYSYSYLSTFESPWYPYSRYIHSVVIQNGVTNIGNSAFYMCENLSSVTIPDSVTVIGDRAFEYCTGLTAFVIPDSVTSIGDFAFTYCKNIYSLTMSKNVKHIGGSAFSNCTRLSSVTVPYGVTSIGDFTFEHCDRLSSITIPDSVTVIGYGAFSECRGLTSVTVPDSVTSIGGSAFYLCLGLSSITVPDSVTSIGYHAFYLTAYYDDSANWENDVLYIGNHLIMAKKDIGKAYIIKSGTKCIADSAFDNCGDLTSITVPVSVTDIGDHAFGFQSYNNGFIPVENFTVYGVSGSEAEKYAEENGLTFAELVCSHTYGEWLTSTEPTCTADGSKYRACTECGKKETEVIAKLGHNYSSEWTVDKEATCTEAGSKSHRCTRCDAKSDVTSIPVIAHTYGEWVETKPATAAEEGEKSKTCSVCGEVITEALPRLAPGATTLAGIANTATGVTITWKATEGADKYIIYRKADGANSWSNYTTVEGDLTSYTDTGVTSGSTYIYTIKAQNVSGYGSYDTAGLTTLYLAEPVVSVANANGGVNVKWNAVRGANGYIVYGRAAGDSAWIRLATVKGNATVSYTDKTAKSGTGYRYTVRAYNGSYRSSFCVGAVIRYLAQPTVTAANANGSVTVKWSKIAGAKGYYIYRKAGGAKSWSRLATITSGTTVAYADKNVASGTAYQYTVKAYNGAYSSSYCAGAATRYLAAGKITSAASTKTGITLKWGSVANATGYTVYRKVGSGSWVKLATVKGSTTVSYLDKTANKGTTYTYCVKPVNGSFAGVYANTVSCKDKY